MYKELFKQHIFLPHGVYLCRAWEDSCDFSLDMLNNTKHTTIVRKHLH